VYNVNGHKKQIIKIAAIMGLHRSKQACVFGSAENAGLKNARLENDGRNYSQVIT